MIRKAKQGRLSLILAISVILILTLESGCGGAGTARIKEIEIGTVLPLTGSESTVGEYYRIAYTMAVDEANKAGGIVVAESGGAPVPIKLTILDCKTDQTTSRSMVEKLATDQKVAAILGNYSTTLVKADMVVAEKYKVPYVTGGAGSEDLFKQGNQYFFGTIPSMFGLVGPGMEWLTAMVDAGKLPKTTRIAAVYENTVSGTEFIEAIKKAASNSSGKLALVFEEPFEPYGKDFVGLLTKVKNVPADAFIANARLDDYILMHRQYTQMGLAHAVVSYGVRGPEARAREALGPASDYLVTFNIWDKTLPYPQVQTFIKKWKEATGKEADAYYAALGYETARVLIAAIQKAGSTDREKIRQALTTVELPNSLVVGQKLKFKPDGHALTQSVLTQNLPKGGAKIVWPLDVATADPVIPIPTTK